MACEVLNVDAIPDGIYFKATLKINMKCKKAPAETPDAFLHF